MRILVRETVFERVRRRYTTSIRSIRSSTTVELYLRIATIFPHWTHDLSFSLCYVTIFNFIQYIYIYIYYNLSTGESSFYYVNCCRCCLFVCCARCTTGRVPVCRVVLCGHFSKVRRPNRVGYVIAISFGRTI